MKIDFSEGPAWQGEHIHVIIVISFVRRVCNAFPAKRSVPELARNLAGASESLLVDGKINFLFVEN